MELGRRLERLYQVFRRLFRAYYTPADQMRLYFEGGAHAGSQAESSPFRVNYYRDREDYVRHVGRLRPRLPVEDSEDFAAWLLSDFSHEGGTVMVAPAPGFYATPGLGKDEVRIAYVLRREDLEASVRILAHALPKYQAEQAARLAGARAKA